MQDNDPTASVQEATGDEMCLGPPCVHFPEWVTTPEMARDYLVYQTLNIKPYRGLLR